MGTDRGKVRKGGRENRGCTVRKLLRRKSLLIPFGSFGEFSFCFNGFKIQSHISLQRVTQRVR